MLCLHVWMDIKCIIGAKGRHKRMSDIPGTAVADGWSLAIMQVLGPVPRSSTKVERTSNHEVFSSVPEFSFFFFTIESFYQCNFLNNSSFQHQLQMPLQYSIAFSIWFQNSFDTILIYFIEEILKFYLAWIYPLIHNKTDLSSFSFCFR